jgi:Leucine-rich repeat (LRR) protein
MLAILGIGCFLCLTESGIEMLARIGNGWNSMTANGSSAKETAAADTIEKLNFLVIREGEDKKVTTITCQGKKIDPKVFEVLPDLYRLGTLNLVNTDVMDEQLKQIGKLHSLTSLLLNGTAVSDKGIKHLDSLSNLETLYLKGAPITDAGFPTLKSLTQLKILDLSNTKLTNAGMKDVAGCLSLEHLLLENTAITDEGLAALEKHPKLKRLTATHTKITPEGVNKLVKSMPNSLTVDPLNAPAGAPPTPDQPEEEKSGEK